MAIKITKRGQLPAEKVYKMTCNSCKTKIEANKGDGEITDDRNESFLVVKCPVCGQGIWSRL
jgi:RNase P subunit RPR2